MRYITFILILFLAIPYTVFGAAQTGTTDMFSFFTSNSVKVFDQLNTAADNTQKMKLTNSNGNSIITGVLFQVVISGITTNVVYRIEGSLDGTNWYNLDYNASTITKTSDGTYTVNYVGNGQDIYIRLYWVSEAGGTAATLDVSAKAYEAKRMEASQ